MQHPITNEEIELTEEQLGCVNYVGDKRKDLVIKSAAGGGKSLVLLQRAANYLNEAKEKNKRRAVAVFTYNHVLATVLKEWLRLTDEDEEYIFIGTLHEYLVQNVYGKIAGSKVGSSPIYANYKDKLLSETIDEYANTHKNNKYKNWGNRFWDREFIWMRSMNILDADDNEAYFKLKREGLGHQHHLDSQDREASFEMFCIYQSKIRGKKLFDNTSAGDDRILFLTHNESIIPDAVKFDHVLIDEAQDQTLAKIIALRGIARLDVTICMDANQRIYEGKWYFSQAGMSPTSKKLSYPFRCTGQIDAFAESLKAHNKSDIPDEDKVEHIMATAKGEKPEVIVCKNEAEESSYVIELIKKWLREDPIHTIGVMCYKNDAVDKVAGWLSREHIEFEIIRNSEDCKFSIRKPGVKLCTMHTSKGLEFMRVILPQFYQGMVPQGWATKDEDEMVQQRNVAYVGMTRAMHQLVIIYNGRRSQFLNEIDSELYSEKSFDEATKITKTNPTPPFIPRKVPEEAKPKRNWSF